MSTPPSPVPLSYALSDVARDVHLDVVAASARHIVTHNYDGPFTLNIECSDGIMGLQNYTLLYVRQISNLHLLADRY